MKKLIILIFFLTTVFSCKTLKGTSQNKLKLKFLDEYIIPENILVDETLVGGLSGIDYANNAYYLICDDAKNPRFYKAEIKLDKSKIDTIIFTSVVKFNDSSHYLDVEAIRFDVKRNNLVITSEGSITYKKDPAFFSVNHKGIIDYFYDIPVSLKATSKQKPRNNGTLEGLTISHDNKGYWIAMELPLEADGPEPKVFETISPIRITNIDATTQRPIKQFAYLLDKIDKIPKGNFAVNGLSDLLEYDNNKFIVIERSYSSGLGLQGNTIKLFDVDATNASNTLSMDGLIDADYKPAHKELLFNFESIRNQLSNQVIDNIEGITFGPTLSNGNRTLLLVADNNFNKLGPQFNQFILLEILDYNE